MLSYIYNTSSEEEEKKNGGKLFFHFYGTLFSRIL